MKGGLFWKVLIGFWLTFGGMMITLWLLLIVGQGHSPEEWVSRRLAPAILSQLQREVAANGLVGFAAARDALPAEDARQVAIHFLPAGPRKWDASLSREAVDAAGRHYLLTYRVPNVAQRAGPLDVPQPVLLIAAIAGMMFSVALAWNLTRPINLLRNGFDQLANGKLDVRLQPLMGRRRDEIASLARDFDIMAARLSQLVTTRDRLLHDVSHELRSPLSRMQLAVGLARQDPAQFEASMGRIEREMGRLDSLIRELLALARAEGGLASAEEYFDPVALVEIVVEDARFEADGISVAVTLKKPELLEDDRPTLRGSAELFRRAFDNIIRNALRFAPNGSVIEVSVELDSNQEGYRFYVRDQGPGVEGVELATLFEPFIKADKAGFGLGLAIAKRAIMAHGGSIDARNRPGGGFEISVVTPCHASGTSSGR